MSESLVNGSAWISLVASTRVITLEGGCGSEGRSWVRRAVYQGLEWGIELGKEGKVEVKNSRFLSLYQRV